MEGSSLSVDHYKHRVRDEMNHFFPKVITSLILNYIWIEAKWIFARSVSNRSTTAGIRKIHAKLTCETNVTIELNFSFSRAIVRLRVRDGSIKLKFEVPSFDFQKELYRVIMTQFDLDEGVRIEEKIMVYIVTYSMWLIRVTSSNECIYTNYLIYIICFLDGSIEYITYEVMHIPVKSICLLTLTQFKASPCQLIGVCSHGLIGIRDASSKPEDDDSFLKEIESCSLNHSGLNEDVPLLVF
jgi:hypothetical protein